jgi:16S rRNA (adenine1518-N6/adenine1519-N6)-dimethyltransferase
MRLYKQRDQHILLDKSVLRRMVDYSELSGEETILEVGCGPGNLTSELLKRARVVGIEKDPRMVEILKGKFRREIGEGRFKIIHGDALRVSFPEFDKFVANIPYSISSPLTFKLLNHDFELAVVMYQREFAERLTAEPGSKTYGRLSVMAKALCKAEIVEEVSRKAFKPVPKVDSAIVKIVPSKQFEIQDSNLFEDLVRFSFSMRRKKFGKILEGWFEKLEVSQALLENFKNHLEKRPEEIEAETFASIANEVRRWISTR